MHWNKLDVVPHAWNPVDLAQVPKLYGVSAKTDKLTSAVSKLIKAAIGLSALSKIEYHRLPNKALTKSQVESTIPPMLLPGHEQKEVANPPDDMISFLSKWVGST